MYALLLRFLVYIAAFLFLNRLIGLIVRGVSGKPKRQPAEGGVSPAKDTVKDPVCGMYMDPRLAIHLENSQGSFYFCSEECRHKFLLSSSAQ
jgi:YHS domain-containing protein